MQPHETPAANIDLPNQFDSDEARPDHGTSSLLPTVCVASNDEIWADLLVQNLSARGASSIKCDLKSLVPQISCMTENSWVVVDGGWPMLELQNACLGINEALGRSGARTVMVVDELVGPHPLPSFEPDKILNRSPDMRVLVRDLLTLFSTYSPDSAKPAI